MAGVFLSYSRADRALADQVIRGLRRVGVEVWWDQDMPGVDWQEELERELNSMVAVVVLWTPHSVSSKYVRDEARLGLHSEKLVNALAGVASPPFPFDRVNGLPLDGWDGHEPHHGWSRLIQTIDALAVQAGSATPSELTAALSRSEQEVRLKQQALTDAQQAFQDAQSLEAEADDAAKSAATASARAEEDLARAGEMRLGPAILRAAQQELDASRAAKDEAVRALRAAKTQLGEASRAMARAKGELDRLFSEAIEGPPKPAKATAPASPQNAGLARHEVEPAGIVLRAEVPAAPTAPLPARKPLAEPTQIGAPSPPPRAGRPAKRSGLSAGQGLIAVGAVVVLGIGALVFLHPSGGSPALSNATDSGGAGNGLASPAIPVESASTTTPPDMATNFVGVWDIGLGCANPVSLSEDNGVLTRAFAGAVAPLTLISSSATGATDFSAPDGSSYKLDHRGLYLIPSGGKAMKMIRCAG
jgi:hypothetical protein